MHSMSTEVWLRNPHNYHRQIREVGHAKTVWNWQTLGRRRTDPVAWSELAFAGLPWETMVVGGEGCPLYRPGDSRAKPSAVFPFWNAADDSIDLLLHLVKHPVSDLSLSDELLGTIRPVPGQEHRIVLGYLPPQHTLEAKALMVQLGEIQRDHPEVVLHHFGVDSFSATMNADLGSLDFDARKFAFHGEICFPMGGHAFPNEVVPEQYHYVSMLDFDLKKLYNDPAYRCVYNINAALWAGKYYQEELNYVVRKPKRRKGLHNFVPLETPEAVASRVENQPQTKNRMLRPVKKSRGDQLSCNHCTLQFSCKVYREGSVCILPNTPGKKLADLFKVRDANSVIDGMNHLLVMQANRLQDAMEDEEQEGQGLSPEVSKEIKSTFENAKTLAQLLDPALKGGPKVINNNHSPNNTLVVANSNPNELVAGIVRQLEQQGIPRDQITQEMISNAMGAMSQNKVIEA